MPAPDAIVELVRQFELHRDQYRNGAFSEVAARHQFIDPFFAALGWDVNNTQGFAEQYKEVVHEDKVKVGGATKAPDYSFRIGKERKFFVEARSPRWTSATASSGVLPMKRRICSPCRSCAITPLTMRLTQTPRWPTWGGR